MNKIKICGITTRPGTAKIMVPTLTYVAEKGYDSYLICQPCNNFNNGAIAPIKYIPVEMGRGAVSPIEVLKCTYRLYKIFKQQKFDIVQYASSNAGLYASIAAWMAHVPVRIFCQWGIPYTDYTGMKLKFFKFMEYFTCLLSTSVQPDSHLNREWAIKEGLFKPKKGVVLGKGSAQGVSLKRFDIQKKTIWREEIRKQYQIPENVKVFCFVGRIVPQKGVNELMEAFIRIDRNDTYLFILGAPDEINSLDQELLTKIKKKKNVVFTGAVSDPERYVAASDYLVLPSYREGFPNTILEAGALGIPSIVTRINGMIDLIVEGKTGFVCEIKSADSLYCAMTKALTQTNEEYKTMSDNVYTTVKNDFDAEYIKECFYQNRQKLIKKANCITDV